MDFLCFRVLTQTQHACTPRGNELLRARAISLLK